MVMNKRKKNSRLRASQTHGWGAKKKHRGAGNRGGRGMAGSGKRADQKKISILKLKDYFGKHGFTARRTVESSQTINVDALDTLGEAINLKEMGYTKLLGSGKVTGKHTITVGYATARAIKKVQDAGGSITQ